MTFERITGEQALRRKRFSEKEFDGAEKATKIRLFDMVKRL
jgi:hypothetical protein